MKEIVAHHGPGSVEPQRHAQRLGTVARVQLLALFLVVADMVLKPTSDAPWTLVVLRDPHRCRGRRRSLAAQGA
jgi:hypothetical protein